MITRRRFIAASAIPTALFGGTANGGNPVEPDGYDAAIARTWHPAAGPIDDRTPRMREMVRLATLAPSSHNTQCWRFETTLRGVDVRPDLTRRCPAVDPDDHHLFVSLGCAVENFAHASLAHGFRSSMRFDHLQGNRIVIELDATRMARTERFAAITERQSTRGPFDGAPLTTAELGRLVEAGTGDGLHVLVMTDRPSRERVLAWVIEANDAQMRDAAFEHELKRWIRFDDAEALRTGDGLATRTTGNPSVPRWLASPVFDAFYRPKSEADKYAAAIRSSAGIAIFVSDVDDKAGWIEAGRCYERFALQATSMGIRNALLNQPIEVTALRPRFAEAFGLGRKRPDLFVRFGRGARMSRSLRRPVEAVLT